MKLLTLQYKSSGEIEATIHGEFARLNIVQYHRNYGSSTLPTLEQACEEMNYSFAYLCTWDDAAARVWFVRLGEAYHVYVSKELPSDLTAALSLVSFGDVSAEVVAPGWTKLVLHDTDSLMLVTAALRRWMFSGAPGVAAAMPVEVRRN